MAQAATQRTDRRREITRALYRCISTQGYANTSLKDVADRAGMSPSHVGYYFDNKEAILEYYAEAICAQNLAGLPDPAEPDLARLLDQIATFGFGEGQMNTALLGLIQELTGLAVHAPALHKIKADHSIGWRKYLEAVFARAERATPASARRAAWQAHAMMVGLHTNTLFDRGLGNETAHTIFRDVLHTLAGLDDPDSGERRTHTTPIRKSPQRRRRKETR